MKKNEIEFEVINRADFKKGSKQYMAEFIAKAKNKGLKLEFLQDVYPLRQYPAWYQNDIAKFIFNSKIEVIVYSTGDVDMTFGDRIYIKSKEDLEENDIYNDQQLSELIDNDMVTSESSGSFYFGIHDKESDDYDVDEPEYSFDLGYDDSWDLHSALNPDIILNAITDYLDLKKQRNTKELKEDKQTKDRFIKIFGQELYDKFIKLKPRLKSPDNDISYWMKKSPNDLILKLDEIDNIKTVKQKQDIARQGSKLLYSDGNWNVYEITTLEASIKYGKETQWCISGVDCDSQSMWDFYMGGSLSPRFNKDTSVFIFFIHKSWGKKWAVLFDKETKNNVIWNELDNITSFIEDSPKIKGLPDFSKIPFKLKQDISKSLKIKIDNIIEIRETESIVYTDDHLEKYWVMYRDSLGDTHQANVYRSPDTEQFVKF